MFILLLQQKYDKINANLISRKIINVCDLIMREVGLSICERMRGFYFYAVFSGSSMKGK